MAGRGSPTYAAVDRRDCVSCGTCAAVCPLGAVEVVRGCYAQVDPARCVGCGRCIRACPTGCIARVEREAAV